MGESKKESRGKLAPTKLNPLKDKHVRWKKVSDEKVSTKQREDEREVITGTHKELMDAQTKQDQKKGSTHVARNDLKFKEIKRKLQKRVKDKKDNNNDNVEQEYYVDSYRMISVHMGTDDDLKNVMKSSGITNNEWGYYSPGQPNDALFVNLAEHHMKKLQYDKALYYVKEALHVNQDSMAAKLTMAKCYLMLGDWKSALKAAETVLEESAMNWRAMLIKAEALFSLCYFEHAMVHFCRGCAIFPDTEDFPLGIQKCKKTIIDTISGSNMFKVNGIEVMFKIMRKTCEMRSMEAFGQLYFSSQTKKVSSMSMADLTSRIVSKRVPDDRKKNEKSCNDPDTKSEENEDKDCSELFTVCTKEKNVIHLPQPKSTTLMIRQQTVNTTSTEKVAVNRTNNIVNKLNNKTTKHIGNDDTKFRPKPASSIDRLFEDKCFLAMLASGVGERRQLSGLAVEQAETVDDIYKHVKNTAEEALGFLTNREDFWDQLELGKELQDNKKNCKTLTLPSYRLCNW